MSKSIETSIRAKTQQLFALKQQYNELVSNTDREFTEKEENLRNCDIHIYLDLAQACLNAINKGPENIPSLINKLKRVRDEDDFSDDEEGIEELNSKYQDVTKSFSSDDYDSDSGLDLSQYQLNMNDFVQQFEDGTQY